MGTKVKENLDAHKKAILHALQQCARDDREAAKKVRKELADKLDPPEPREVEATERLARALEQQADACDEAYDALDAGTIYLRRYDR